MFTKNEKNENDNIKFYSLAPTDNAKNSKVYISALDWAVKEPNIKNIAVTGNYGSGKSSVLNTYQKNSQNKKCFLNISLATFEQKDYNEDENIIEKSILQQLFYKEKVSKTPFSRFKKINNLNDNLWLKIIIMIIFVFSIIWFINPDIFTNIKDFIIEKLNYNFLFFNNWVDNILNFFIKAIFIIFGTIAIIYILNILYKIIANISCKLTIKKYDMELEVTPKGEQSSESIFNKYIDEIIYFFEVTDYDIVIFEDLDRLKNYSSLFIKLREVNTLLNNSKIIKKDKITFIYAVKDDVFNNDKERTKFFEFIIPIMPVINSNNSKDKLLELLEGMPYKDELSDLKFLNNISLYIDDMRLLNSIVNELNIYYEQLKQIKIEFDIEKLFSLIVYKNLFSEDFSNLQNNRGILYKIFNNKEKNLENILSNLNREEESLKSEIENLQYKYNVRSIEDLKRIIWTYIKQAYSNYSSFYINNKRYNTIGEFLNDNNLNTTESLKNISVSPDNYTVKNIKEIINNLDEKIEYTKKELEKILEEKYKELSIVEKKILEIKNKKVSEIINIYGVKNYYNIPENMSILTYLLRNEYIDETYREYINYFYPKTLKIEDKNFILNFNNAKVTDQNYKLHNIENIIQYFSEEDFLKKEILNFDLFEYMLERGAFYNLQLENIFKQLNDNAHNYGLVFLREYIIARKVNKYFFEYLIKYCSKMWYELSQSLEEEYNKTLLLGILRFVDLDDIKEKLSSDQNFINAVNECNYFCGIFNEDDSERAKSILQILNIKLINIGNNSINSSVFDIVYKENRYEINVENIELILNKKMNKSIDDIQTKNYTCISEYKELHEYVSSNIETYINNVFLKYENNTMEDIVAINELMANEKLDIQAKRKIIIKEQEINDLELVDDIIINDDSEVILWGIYLEENKVIPNFSNIIKYYNKYGLDDKLVVFMNNNAEILEKKDTSDLSEKFIKNVIRNYKINDKNFELIVTSGSNTYRFNEFDFSNITEERCRKILATSKIIIKFNESNYNNLKNSYNDLLINFVENSIKEFYVIMNNIDYDDILITDVILSHKIERNMKINILCKCKDTIRFNNISQKQNIIGFILRGRKPININYNLFKQLFNNMLDSTTLINLLMFQSHLLSNEQISECLLKLSKPYSEIPKQNKRPKIEINSQNTRFKEFLERRKFKYLGRIAKTKDGKFYQVNKKSRVS